MTDVVQDADGMHFDRSGPEGSTPEPDVRRVTGFQPPILIAEEARRDGREFGAATATERKGSDDAIQADRFSTSADGGPPDQAPARGFRAGFRRFSEGLNSFLDQLLAPLIPDEGNAARTARELDQGDVPT